MPDIPDYQTLMLPVLRLAAKGEVTVPGIVGELAADFQLTPEQLAQRIPSGGFPLFNNRIHWAKTYMIKAGLVEQVRRGVFRATDRGRQLLASSPTRIDNRTLAQFAEFRSFAGRRVANTHNAGVPVETLAQERETPAERIDAAIHDIEAEVRDEILARIFAIEDTTRRAAFFEELVVELLMAMGYGKGLQGAGRRIGGTGDGGVDGVIHLDALGIDRVYVQAKCYDRNASVQESQVRDFSGSLDTRKTTRGVFITTARFSEPSRRYVQSIQKQIVLIDAEELARLMLQYNIGVREDRTVIIKRLDEDFFGE
ncbi:MAG TPA: restriction endonuclease [Hyphomicrobiaceae bacterium]|nr:restriction endonuclease [Hyphomicrobiaceae bacterium]